MAEDRAMEPTVSVTEMWTRQVRPWETVTVRLYPGQTKFHFFVSEPLVGPRAIAAESVRDESK